MFGKVWQPEFSFPGSADGKQSQGNLTENIKSTLILTDSISSSVIDESIY